MKRRVALCLSALVVAASPSVVAQRRPRPPLPVLPSAPASSSAPAAAAPAEAPAPPVAQPDTPEPPPREEPPPPPPPPPPSPTATPVAPAEPPGPPRGALSFGAEVGIRAQRITSAGYDPFSTDDWHRFASLSGWFAPLTRGALSLAATGGWDVGNSSAYARGQATSLTMHRLWLAPEGRLAVGTLGHVLVRVGPSVWHMRAELVDGGVTEPLVRRPWVIGGDAAVGARARALELRDERGAWLIGLVGVELGYAYVASVKMNMQPKPGALEPRDVNGVRLPDLSASGYTVRLTAAAAF